jgi:hypothetical protein
VVSTLVRGARVAADLVDYLAVVLVAWIVPESGDLRAAADLLNARTCMSVHARTARDLRTRGAGGLRYQHERSIRRLFEAVA